MSLKCSSCKRVESETIRSFFDLTVHLKKDSQTMEECIENCFQDEIVSDVNCAYCWLATIQKKLANKPEILQKVNELMNLPACDYDEARCDLAYEFGDDSDVKNLLETVKCRRTKTKSTKIIKYPNILIVKVERMVPDRAGNIRKDNRKINVAERLELNQPKTQFDLCAVIEHMGGRHSSGHYFCAKRNFLMVQPFVQEKEDNTSTFKYLNWSMISDEQVFNVHAEDLKSLTGYLFAYQQSSPAKDSSTAEAVDDPNPRTGALAKEPEPAHIPSDSKAVQGQPDSSKAKSQPPQERDQPTTVQAATE